VITPLAAPRNSYKGNYPPHAQENPPRNITLEEKEIALIVLESMQKHTTQSSPPYSQSRLRVSSRHVQADTPLQDYLHKGSGRHPTVSSGWGGAYPEGMGLGGDSSF